MIENAGIAQLIGRTIGQITDPHAAAKGQQRQQ
jgi:hypothetical protein